MSCATGPIFNQLKSLEPGGFPFAQATVTCDPAGAAAGAATDPNCFGQGGYTGTILGFGQMLPGSTVGLSTPQFLGLVYPVQVYGSSTTLGTSRTDQARFSIKFDHKLTDRDQLISLIFSMTYRDRTAASAEIPRSEFQSLYLRAPRMRHSVGHETSPADY